MTCHEFNEFLFDYQADDLVPEKRTRCEAHLVRCSPCVASLRSYGQTIRFAQEAFSHPDHAGSKDVPDALVHVILAARLRMQR